MLKESIRMSWKNICGNKMRTFLTMLGIIIGVTAIIALITTVSSATNEITSQFSALGAGKVSVTIYGTNIKKGLNEADLSRIEALDNVAGVDPNVSISTYAAQTGLLIEDVTVDGRSSYYFDSQEDLIARGRALKLSDMDRTATYALSTRHLPLPHSVMKIRSTIPSSLMDSASQWLASSATPAPTISCLP